MTTPGSADREVGDPGLQPERTGLAWRRTGLALVAGSLAAMRVLVARYGPEGAVPGMLGLVSALVIVLLAQRRYHAHREHLAVHGPSGGPVPVGGGLAFVTAVVTVVLGVSALALVVVG